MGGDVANDPSTDLVQAGDDEQLLLLLQCLPHVLSLALHLNRTVDLHLLTMPYTLARSLLFYAWPYLRCDQTLT